MDLRIESDLLKQIQQDWDRLKTLNQTEQKNKTL